ncbi:MAG: stilbene synthase [Candidatus Kapabacteria bacterium]|nr:stilbene synthase [Candidatus Kapabacteria bacterium]
MTSSPVAGIGTAVPSHVARQRDVRQIVARLFEDRSHDLERILAVFDHDHIHQRHFAMPLDWYGTSVSWSEQNALWERHATELGTQALQRAMVDADLPMDALDCIIVVSTTGFATPSLDARIIAMSNAPHTVQRIPVVGLGCAGGVSGLALAGAMSSPNRCVAVVAVEVCSVTFQRNDVSKSNIVGTSLFADGAAAVVLHPSGRGPRVHSGVSRMFPNTFDIMGWDVHNDGLQVRFRRDIPAFIRMHGHETYQQACEKWGITPQDVNQIVVHPGGAKVLDALTDAYGRRPDETIHAREVLKSHGNMSSPTVLFVLERALRHGPLPGKTVLSALGPGFSSELCLLEQP